MNSEQAEPTRPETVPYLENYATAAQDKAHIKPELDRILRNPDYDTKGHFDNCGKCQKAAGEMIKRDTKKFGKPKDSETPAWMIEK